MFCIELLKFTYLKCVYAPIEELNLCRWLVVVNAHFGPAEWTISSHDPSQRRPLKGLLFFVESTQQPRLSSERQRIIIISHHTLFKLDKATPRNNQHSTLAYLQDGHEQLLLDECEMRHLCPCACGCWVSAHTLFTYTMATAEPVSGNEIESWRNCISFVAHIRTQPQTHCH